MTLRVCQNSESLKRMQEEMPDDVLDRASDDISHALACAGRHTGSCTTSLNLRTQAVRHSLTNLQGQPGALTGLRMLANLFCLELELDSHDDNGNDDASITQFAHKLLQRLPNLRSARLQLGGYSEVPHIPLLQLKHLDLGVINADPLDGMPFAALLPALETTSITVVEGLSYVLELDVSGCQHLTRLVIHNLLVERLLKPPLCRLRVDIPTWYECGLEASLLQQGLSEVNEILLYSQEFRPPRGLLAQICLPKLEVVRCLWSEDDDKTDGTRLNVFRHCLEPTCRNLPALKSVLCGDWDDDDLPNSVMRACIPRSLAGVQELIFATDRPLRLHFECARSAGEKLNTFCAVGREVRGDVAALVEMIDALFRRGLTLSLAQAKWEHEDSPSQCMYIRALSAPQLSYVEAIGYVNARVQKWGRDHDACAQCGACFSCLRKAGILECI